MSVTIPIVAADGTPSTVTIAAPVISTVGVPKIATLADDFTTKDTTKWIWGGAAATAAGQLILPVAAANVNYIATPIPYDLTSSQIVAKLAIPPNPGNGNQQTWLELANAARTNRLAIMVSGDGVADGYLRVVCRDTINGVASDTYVPYASIAAYEQWDNFWADANTTKPLAAPSGQSYLRTYGGSATPSPPVITNGKLVENFTGAGVSADYISAQLSGIVKFVTTDFDFSGTYTTDSSGMAIAVFSGAISTQDGPFSGLPGYIMHCVFVPNGYDFNFPSVQSVYYADRIPVQHVEVVFDKPNSTAHIRGADGIWRSHVSAGIGTGSPTWTFCESYYNNSNTDPRVEISRHAASSVALGSNLFPSTNAPCWVRIREAAGIVYWEASSDGVNWGTLNSTTPGWDVSQCYVRLSSDYSGTEPNLSSASWASVGSGGSAPTPPANTFPLTFPIAF